MTKRNINTDIEGIIREINLSFDDVMYPLFEAVVNSIQSIHERGSEFGDGIIKIYVERDRQNPEIFESEGCYPIKSIKIVDNGIGFNDSNYDSFFKSHSTKKHNIGGKGVGRFTMLSVYDTMHIKSTFVEKSEFVTRNFELSRNNGIIESDTIVSISSKVETAVILSNINEHYKNASARYTQERIADAILEHCLLYYLNGNPPIIKVIENNESIDLTRQFNPSDFVLDIYESNILDQKFICYYVKNTKINHHEYLLCAHNRKVKSKRISTIFPIFSSQIKNGNDDIWIQAYIVSDYLDCLVNIARDEIKFPKVKKRNEVDEDQQEVIKIPRSEIIEKDIDDFVVSGLYVKYNSEIKDRQNVLKEKVLEYLSSDDGLEYRTLEIDNDFISTIPFAANEKKLDDILHEKQFKDRCKLREKRAKLLKRDFSNNNDYQTLLSNVVSLITKEGTAKLGQYVAHRKTVIELLEKYLEWCDENDNYQEEAPLHNLIFVMGGTHDNTPYDYHNLWLLDDRLAFHKYIYSDVASKKHYIAEGNTESRKEIDLAIYDTPFIYGEKTDYNNITSAVIFEFKRPNRSLTYEEFSKQMDTQLESVNLGKITDSKGKHIDTSDATPVFYYYVCDINAYNNLKYRAKMNGYKETPSKSLMRLVENIYVEIMTYQTVLSNSRRRNRAFFKKLGIE